MKCRHCGQPLHLTFLDLGSAPPSNAYLSEAALRAPEVWFPLRVLVCTHCWLVQTEDHAGREALFTHDYAYFSSFSTSWLAHAKAYVQAMQQRLGLGEGSCVVEVASNDGYLLQYVQQAGIPCYGIEPTASTAKAQLERRGVQVTEDIAAAQGVDAVLLAVKGTQARALMPRLALAGITTATRVATSQIVSGTGKPAEDAALDGIVFPGEAWAARGVAGLPAYSQVTAMLPTARGGGARLFAFGHDAWLISAFLERLVTRSDGQLHGATGTLRLDGFGNVVRQPQWSTFSGGVVQPLVGGGY